MKPTTTKKRLATTGGVVSGYLANTAAAKRLAPSHLAVVKALQAGLPYGELETLRAAFDLPMDQLAPMLGISKATLHRRKAEGKLDTAESDRVVRFARLLGKAIEVMESEDAAKQWMTSAQFGLAGDTPLHFAETEVGAREVEDLLGRIEHGVYS